MVEQGQTRWTLEITPRRHIFAIPVREIWDYRDLLMLLVRRDFVALYKQTILGPLWFILQPLLMTLVFTVVFAGIAKIPTDGIPPVLFYLAGITLWTYFSDTLTKTSETFTTNANLFGKVYFPRMIMPLSIVVSGLFKLGVQFTTFLVFLAFYAFKGAAVAPNMAILMVPVLVLIMAAMGLGGGMIVSALTTKYRDLRFLLTFAVQLLMYATPVIYPASALPAKYAVFIAVNPITPLVESFRYAFLGRGEFDLAALAYSAGFAAALLVVAMVVFNQVEKNFMDTV